MDKRILFAAGVVLVMFLSLPLAANLKHAARDTVRGGEENAGICPLPAADAKARLDTGMSIAEVERAIGAPGRKVTLDEAGAVRYDWDCPGNGSLRVLFEHGKATALLAEAPQL